MSPMKKRFWNLNETILVKWRLKKKDSEASFDINKVSTVKRDNTDVASVTMLPNNLMTSWNITESTQKINHTALTSVGRISFLILLENTHENSHWGDAIQVYTVWMGMCSGSQLQNHEMPHRRKAIWVWPVWKKHFLIKVQFHFKSCIEGKKPYKCDQCGKKCLSFDCCSSIYIGSHRKKYNRCDQCEKRFPCFPLMFVEWHLLD